MITAAAFLAVLLILGYVWHRREKAHDAEHTDLLRINAEAAEDILEYEGDLAEASDALAKSVCTSERALEDVEWQKVLHAIALGELDRVTERHHTLLSLDGIRADRAQGITYDGAEPPLSVAVRTAGEVVPIKGKGGKR